MSFRIGIGYDLHRLKKGRPLIIGGVKIPFAKGLEGHSDADVLLHAIIDAMLGAAALPDIGHFFPPSKASIQGISSRVMLARAFSEIRKKGYRIGNIDSVIIAEAPKISPYREAIRARIAKDLQMPMDAIQVKGKTNEKLDAIGCGQAIAAQAVVLLVKKG